MNDYAQGFPCGADEAHTSSFNKRVVDTPPATPPPSKMHTVSSSPSLRKMGQRALYNEQSQPPPYPSSPTTASQPTTAPSPSSIPSVSALITSIATGVPPTSRSQTKVAAQVSALFGPSSPHYTRIPRLYANTRITTRHKAVDPLDPTFDRNLPIRQRMNLFLEHASPLCVDVATRAVSSPSSGISSPSRDIGLLVVVTSTGFIAPGVDVAIVRGLGLSRSVKREIINFMGCAAAMNGIRAASDYAVAQQYASLHTGEPPKKALLVCVELSSVNGVFAETINDVIISSLFGDGCAALVIGSTSTSEAVNTKPPFPGQIILGPSFSHLVDDTESGIMLGVNHNGITCELSPLLPTYIRTAVGPVLEKTLASHGLTKSAIHLWAIHPGGPKIIEESVKSLDLPDEVAATSWDILSRYGNMLSVSLPFVLQQMVEEARSKRPVSTGVAFSFGPGITIEGVVFDVIGEA